MPAGRTPWRTAGWVVPDVSPVPAHGSYTFTALVPPPYTCLSITHRRLFTAAPAPVANGLPVKYTAFSSSDRPG